jgi:ParB/RepB/Spo0J family partition protein
MAKQQQKAPTLPAKGAAKAAEAQKALSVSSVPLKQISLEDNYRKDLGDIASLADSIEKHGLLQPVFLRVVGKGEYQVVAGERRVRAHQHLKRTHIEAKVASNMSDKVFFELKLLENLQRKDPHPLETAEGLQRALDAGSKVEELAESTGRSVSSIRASLKLLGLCPMGRKLFLAGKVLTESTALYVARIRNPKVQEAALEKLKKLAEEEGESPSARAVNEVIHREFMLRLKDAPFNVKTADLVKGVGACEGCPKRTGNDPSFKDVTEDLCTDMVCWGQKRDATWERARQEAKQVGHHVLSEKDTKGVFYAYGDGLVHNSGYVSLSQKCPDDPKGRTYKALLAKVVEASPDLVTVARAPSGAVHKLIPTAGLTKQLRSAGHDFKKEKAELAQKDAARRAEREEKDEKAQERKRREAQYREGLARVLSTALQRPLEGTLAFFAATYDVKERLEWVDEFWELPGQLSPEEFAKSIPAMSPAQVLNLLLAEHLFTSQDRWRYVHRDTDDDCLVTRACRHFGVELEGQQEAVSPGAAVPAAFDVDPSRWLIEPAATHEASVSVWLVHEESGTRLPATWWPASASQARLEYGHLLGGSPKTPEDDARQATWEAHPGFVEALVGRIFDGDGNLPPCLCEDSAERAAADAPSAGGAEAQTSVTTPELRQYTVMDGWSVHLGDSMKPGGFPELLLRSDVEDQVVGRFAYVGGRLQPADTDSTHLHAWAQENAGVLEELQVGIARGKVPPLLLPAPAAAAETSSPSEPKRTRRQRS